MAAVRCLKVVLDLAAVHYISSDLSSSKKIPNEDDCSSLCILNATCYRYWSPTIEDRSRRYGIFKVVRNATYVGCYEDNANRIFPVGNFTYKNMTNEFCREYCISKQSIYFGTQAKQWCYCGDTLPAYKQKDEKYCDLSCLGDTREICGGDWHLSMYLTGLQTTTE